MLLAASIDACSSASRGNEPSSTAVDASPSVAISAAGPGRGFPTLGPWATYYGAAASLDLIKTAAAYRIIVIDADPGIANFTRNHIATLRAGGTNRVLSYFNIGAIESFRTYWKQVPAGYVAPAANTDAQLGPYASYPDEVWMNPANDAWQRVLVDVVAPRLVAQGIDGFFFDNLEILTHDETSTKPACDETCVRGGFALVATLRARYPNLLFIMQGGTESTTRRGTVGTSTYASLLDGVAHESVFTQQVGSAEVLKTDPGVVADLRAWNDAALQPGGRTFFVGALDYVNSCTNTTSAMEVYRQSRAAQFSPYASDTSAKQQTICFWNF